MPPTENQYDKVEELIEQNTELIRQNQVILKKLHRNAIIGFWLRIFWYTLLIGLPFALYFYILEPYFAALGSSYDTFSAGIKEIPGWKQILELLENVRAE